MDTLSNSDSDNLFFEPIVSAYVNNPRFLRRDWLAAEVETNLAAAGSRFVLLTAEPGFGKSVFIAQLAHDHPNWLRYFIRRDQREPLGDVGSRSFLLRIGYQLAARYPELFDNDAVRLSVEQRIGEVTDRATVVGAEIQKIVASPFYTKVVEISQQVTCVAGNVVGLRIGELAIEPHLIDPVNLQHMALIDPARAMQRLHRDHQIVILVDALDEIRYHQVDDNILTWLRDCPDLPANVHFVLTSRSPADDVRLFMDKQQSVLHKIDLTSQGGEPAAKLYELAAKDIVTYVDALADDARIKPHLEDQSNSVVSFKQQVVAKADGNIGYLDALARAIDQTLANEDDKALATLLAVKSLPDTIQGLYAFFLHQIKVKVGETHILIEVPDTGAKVLVPIWSAVYDPLLGILAIAREPVTLEQIQQLGGITAQWTDLNTAKNSLLQFLDIVNNRYRFYHTTVPEFLTDERTKDSPELQDLYIDAQTWHQRIGNYYWQTYQNDWAQCEDLYALRHTAEHLARAARSLVKPLQRMAQRKLEEALSKMLLDFGWLRAKLNVTDITSTIADYELLPSAHEVTLIRDALRLSAYVLANDKTQMAGQLLGRLMGYSQLAIQALLKQVAEYHDSAWLRPLISSLETPGGALERTITGHRSGVNGLVLTPDSQHLLSASSDRTLKLWDLATGVCERTFLDHAAWVNAVTVTADATRAFTASWDKTVKVWMLETGTLERTLSGREGAKLSVAVTPDGRWIAAGSSDGTIYVWEITSKSNSNSTDGVAAFILKDHKDAVNAIAISPDGKRLLSASRDCTLKVWNISMHSKDNQGKGSLEFTLSGHRRSIEAMAITPDGLLAISGSEDGTLMVWDLHKSGNPKHTLVGHAAVRAVAVTSDGAHIISGSEDKMVRVWNLATGQLERTLVGHTEAVKAVAVTNNGTHVISGSTSGVLKVWNISSTQEDSAESGRNGHPHAYHKAMVVSIAVTPNKKYAISASVDGTLKVWNLHPFREERTLKGHTETVRSVATLPDNIHAVSAAWDQSLRVWNIQTGQTELTVPTGKSYINAIAAVGDSLNIVTVSADPLLRIWDLRAGKLEREIRTSHNEQVTALAITSDGRLAVTGSMDTTLEIWNLPADKVLYALKGHRAAVVSVAVTDDGLRAVSASRDFTAKIWNLQQQIEEHKLEGHTSRVYGAAVTYDNKLVLTVAEDQTARVWDMISGQLVATFTSDAMCTACAAVDDRSFLVGDASGRLHFLRLE